MTIWNCRELRIEPGWALWGHKVAHTSNCNPRCHLGEETLSRNDTLSLGSRLDTSYWIDTLGERRGCKVLPLLIKIVNYSLTVGIVVN